MEEYQRTLSTHILEKLDKTAIPLLEIALKMERESKAPSQGKELKGLPLLDPNTLSIFAKPLVISIIAGVISKVVYDVARDALKFRSRKTTAKVVITNKKGILKESLQIAVKFGVEKKTIARIQKEVFTLLENHPEILSIDYKRRK